MKIEKPGKYLTRDGSDAVVTEIFEGRAYGRTIDSNIYWESCDWDAETGCFYRNKTYFELDIISEHVPPKPRMLAWVGDAVGSVILKVDGDDPVGAWKRAPWLDEPKEEK